MTQMLSHTFYYRFLLLDDSIVITLLIISTYILLEVPNLALIITNMYVVAFAIIEKVCLIVDNTSHKR